MLRRDVHGWLRRRGLTCPEDVEAKVLWLHGGVGGFFNIGNKIGRFGYLNAPFTAAAVTPSWFLVESQWPLVLWRRRLVIPAGTTLRQIDGRIASVVVTIAVFSVAYTTGPMLTVVLLAVTLFFQRWTGLYWSIPSILGTRDKVGLLGGTMNLGGNIGGVLVPLVVGWIVQLTGSYFLAMMVFTGAGIGLLLCSVGIDYEKKLPV